jgi:hypothetical protein
MAGASSMTSAGCGAMPSARMWLSARYSRQIGAAWPFHIRRPAEVIFHPADCAARFGSALHSFSVAVDIKQVGRELGVRYVLEGSVRKAGNRVRITGQLVDAATGNHIWADRYDSTLEDIFDLQDRVTTSVIGAIAPRLERPKLRGLSANRPRAYKHTITIFAPWQVFLALREKRI